MAMAGIIMGTVYLSIPVYAQTEDAEQFSGLVIDLQGSIPFKLVATIMEIHQGDNPNVVVAEKTILITEYKYSNTIQRTQLLNNSGNTIEISDLEIGQRVIVEGLELSDKTLVGEQIQVKPKK